jgi:hypothetical protein
VPETKIAATRKRGRMERLLKKEKKGQAMGPSDDLTDEVFRPASLLRSARAFRYARR